MNSDRALFWEHVEELRTALLKSGAIIALTTLVIFYFFPTIFSSFTAPVQGSSTLEITALERIQVRNTSPALGLFNGVEVNPGETHVFEQAKKPFILLTPLEGVVTSLKSSFWMALALSYPVWGYFIFSFAAPGLAGRERGLACAFFVTTLLSLFIGAILGYRYALAPLSMLFARMNAELGDNLWTVQGALSFELYILIASGLIFQLASSLLLLIHYDYATYPFLAKYRRPIYVGVFVLSAAVTPPDIITQLSVATPLICAFELSLLYAKIRFSIAEWNLKKGMQYGSSNYR